MPIFQAQCLAKEHKLRKMLQKKIKDLISAARNPGIKNIIFVYRVGKLSSERHFRNWAQKLSWEIHFWNWVDKYCFLVAACCLCHGGTTTVHSYGASIACCLCSGGRLTVHWNKYCLLATSPPQWIEWVLSIAVACCSFACCLCSGLTLNVME